MASRVTLYGKPHDPDMKRLKREMNVMFVEYEQCDPESDARARRRLDDWGEAWVDGAKRKPLVEVALQDGSGSVFLENPDEPTLRQSLYSEGILSTTAYWV